MTAAGEADTADIAAKVSPRTRLIAVTHVHSVFGALTTLEELRGRLDPRVRLCFDCSQSAGHVPVDVTELGCDFAVFSGHKLFGVAGTGMLYARRRVHRELAPFLPGGGTGVGLGAIAAHNQALTRFLVSRLRELPRLALLPGVAWAACPVGYGIVSFRVDGVRSDDVGFALSSRVRASAPSTLSGTRATRSSRPDDRPAAARPPAGPVPPRRRGRAGRAARAVRFAAARAVPGDLHGQRGPVRRDFLGVLAGSGVTVNVDNLWELGELIRLARAGGHRTPVLVRVCGFGPGRPSRFGVPAGRFDAVTGLLSAARDAVDFLGLSFHLDSSEVRDKVLAVDACLRLLERAWAAGLSPRVLDVGGGFRQAFAESAEPFAEYGRAVRRGLTGQGPPLTWGGATLGYRFEDGAVRGTLTSGKYAGTGTGREFLRELAASPLPGQGGRTVARVLGENMIELWLEPGKSLVDHAGLTLASVEFTKGAPDGSVLVNLDLSRDKICPADQEVMLDPVVLYRSPAPPSLSPAGARTGVFFAGNLCLERDMIFNHLTFVDRIPEPGDIVAFVNTAGYQMDLSASAALMQRQPAKAVIRAAAGGFAAHADHEEAEACPTSRSPS